jgi:hypothetical protein
MTVLNFPEILQRNNELILTELQYESDMLMKYIKLHAYEEKIAVLDDSFRNSCYKSSR